MKAKNGKNREATLPIFRHLRYAAHAANGDALVLQGFVFNSQKCSHTFVNWY